MVRGKDVVGIQDWENNAQFHSRGVSDIGGWRGGGEGSSAETERERDCVWTAVPKYEPS